MYQKTFYLASGSLSTGTLDIPNDLTNIDRVVGYSGVVHSDSEDRDFKLPYTRVQYNESIFILNMVLIDDTVAISIISGDHSSYNQLSNIYVTLQYTKTTDTAGSGTWTPQGVPAVHYSTDEKVVGTWIDGSTVYEKTFYIQSMGNYDDSIDGYLIAENIVVDDLIEANGFVKISTGQNYGHSYVHITNGFSMLNSYEFALHLNDKGQLLLWTDTGSLGGGIVGQELFITIQYTKPTT